MHNRRAVILAAALAVAGLVSTGPVTPAMAATAEELDKAADQALQTLYRINPGAEALSRQAKAILVFPNIVKAGLVVGGAYGEGELREGGKTTGFYNSVTASWGYQAGAQSFGYVVFLMTPKAVDYLRTSRGWEVGVGPTIVVADAGLAANLSTSTLKDDAYAFIFSQQGLMAGLSIEGTKITKIER